MRTLFIFIFTITLISCGNEQSKPRVLSKEDFINLLVDLHLTDALATDHSASTITGNLDSLTIYSGVFEKYHADKATFEKTLEWYSVHPDKFSEVYDEVFGKLNKYTHELNNEQALFNKKGIKPVWTKPGSVVVSGDTANYPKPVLIALDTPGTYLLDFQIRMLPQDESIDPRIIAYFCKSQSDKNEEERLPFVDFPIQKSVFMRDFQFTSKLEDPGYKYLKIFIPQTRNTDTIFMKNIQISDLKVLLLKEPIEEPDKK